MPESSLIRRGTIEAAFILASILLAFWIDAWWDRRQAVDLESAMMGAVAEELVRNQAGLDNFISRLDADLDRIDRFLRSTEASLRSLSPDSVQPWVGALNGRSSFNADLEAVAMLLGFPAQDSEEGLATRGILASWRNEVEEAELLGAQLDEAQIRVQNILARYAADASESGIDNVSQMVARLGVPGLSEIRRDDAVVAEIINKAEAQRLHRMFLIQARESSEPLLEAVARLANR